MTTASTQPAPRPSLSALAPVKLNEHNQKLMDFAAVTCQGSLEWQNRKRHELHRVLTLAQLSGRLHVEFVDLFDAMRVSLVMQVPIPCLPNPNEPVQIQTHVRLGLTYRREAIFAPQPGYSFINILWPRFVWHSNIAFDPRHPFPPLCLGAKLPANLPATELLLRSFHAISLQDISLDFLDPAGVLNPAAADYWQRNAARVPLTREPFVIPAREAK